ncbi:histidine kinase (cheA) [Pyrococcus sp. NA2]|uniref:chemotaxis protein CheA n=1 Tax=Pyrococcus sp. (strain NA2) TaxID=342949 RepID=UPI000209AB5E|nr:chemotaxis protein CheA [Pyrococcus sp. NA2]AEC52050.1 histidine kinase (cheA) [Pyrococcus sp. NA2]
MSQYLDEFLADARDRIDSLSNAILTLEKIVKEGGSEEERAELINQIFRDAHTLKGTAATMGFMKLSETAHKMENLFDAIRNNQIELTPELVDLVLDFLDAIEAMVNNIEESGSEGDVDVSELFERADEFLGKGKEVQKEEKIKAKEEVKEEEEIKAEVPGEGNIYHIKVYFQKDAPLKGVRAFLILSDLEERGEVFWTNPEREAIENGNVDADVVEFKVKTDVPKEELERVIKRHPEVENVEISEEERKAGEKEYKIRVYFQADAPLKGPRSFLILKDLEGIGEIVQTNPSRGEIEDGRLIEDKYFEVVLRTSESPERIKELIRKHPDVANFEVIPKEEEIKEEKKEEKKVAQPPKQPKKPQVIETPKVKISRVIKIDVSYLDKLMNLVGELVITKGRLEQIGERLGDRELFEALSTLSRLLTELQDEIMEMRLTPIGEVFNKFPRMVRDLARKMGKEVEFIMEGADIEVDRTILEKLGDALVHLLRNAVDHGIEPPEERVKLGKPRAGRVELIAKREKNHVVIIVRDDGRGIDPEKVKKKAIERGLITPEEAANLSDEEAINLIFLPGFSTAEKVTDVSGRGVGMDVVKEVVKSMNGSISVQTEVGKGTTFILKLPISMAIIQALLIRVENEIYAIPINNILETIEVDKSILKTIGGKPVIVLRGEIIPVIMLHELFGLPVPEVDSFPAIIVDHGAQKVAIGVDELLHKRDIVIKSLGKFLSNVRGFAGATILGDGSVVLIIDIGGLLGGGYSG